MTIVKMPEKIEALQTTLGYIIGWGRINYHKINNNDNKIREDHILGRNQPEKGKYLIPCPIICNHDGKRCARIKSMKKPPLCAGQFYYVRSRPGK
jgi:hypothetical protein